MTAIIMRTATRIIHFPYGSPEDGLGFSASFEFLLSLTDI